MYDDKIKTFEYLIMLYVDWFKELNPYKNIDLNKIKVMRLLFFTSAINSDENNEGLLGIFDNFHAYPYGTIEEDIYNNLDKLEYCKFKNNSIELFDVNIDTYNKVLCDEAVKSLRLINNNLINESFTSLNDLNQEWYSWRSTYKLARKMNKNTMKIPIPIIRREQKYFDVLK